MCYHMCYHEDSGVHLYTHIHYRRHLEQRLRLADGRAHLVLDLLGGHELVFDLVVGDGALAVDLVEAQPRHRLEQLLGGGVEEGAGRIAFCVCELELALF